MTVNTPQISGFDPVREFEEFWVDFVSGHQSRSTRELSFAKLAAATAWAFCAKSIEQHAQDTLAGQDEQRKLLLENPLGYARALAIESGFIPKPA